MEILTQPRKTQLQGVMRFRFKSKVTFFPQQTFTKDYDYSIGDGEEDIETYNKDLVSKHEQTQDAALQDLYAEYEKGTVRKAKMLKFCLTLGHKIMPSIAIWFVISYWMAGMFEYNMINFSLNVTCEIIFTIIYFTTVYVVNFLVMRHLKQNKSAAG